MPYNEYYAATCPVCGYRKQLRVDDKFVAHFDKTGARCPGSGRSVTELKKATGTKGNSATLLSSNFYREPVKVRIERPRRGLLTRILRIMRPVGKETV